ncbi:MAG: maleylpyruvate isomerase N-terminal domain-containing protein [Actinomycetota bacterium]
MAIDDTPTRRRAIRILEGGHAEVNDLLDRLPPRALSRPGLGGGDWSPKDLVGHLESWEECAIEALDAWAEGKGVPIDKELWSRGTSRVNVDAVARKSSRSAPEMRRLAERTHAELIRRLEALTDARWKAPGTPRGRKAVGSRMGGILGGPTGDYRHAQAHLKDLRAFVAEHGRR